MKKIKIIKIKKPLFSFNTVIKCRALANVNNLGRTILTYLKVRLGLALYVISPNAHIALLYTLNLSFSAGNISLLSLISETNFSKISLKDGDNISNEKRDISPIKEYKLCLTPGHSS